MPWAWSSLIIELLQREFFFLEPDFSNMSESSEVVEPPDNNWRSDNRQFSQTSSLDVFPGGISLETNTNLRNGGDVDRILHAPLRGLHLQTLAKESQKDPNIPTRREKDIRLLLLLLFLLLHHDLIIRHMIMADTKEVDIVHRLHRILAFSSLR